MLFSKIAANPDDDACVAPRRVSEELTKMRMVGRLQLILYDYEAAASQVFGYNVDSKIANRALPFNKL